MAPRSRAASLWPGLPQAAGLLFFAFAGYARIATLGEEVRNPRRTIRRAIPTALGITLVVYAAVAVALLLVLPVAALGASAAPFTDAARAAGVPGLAPVVRVGAAVTALVLTTDLRGAIGFSSFGVLLYYAVANAAAWTLSPPKAVRCAPFRSSDCSAACCWPSACPGRPCSAGPRYSPRWPWCTPPVTRAGTRRGSERG
ncbi:membrane hypothetical protein [Frankia sp. Hr75.2]|nr:membrane hypothetical protein [Frankia sp. Hr75.2]